MFYFYTMLVILLKGVCIILPVLISVAFLTLLERKMMAAMQRSRGPNVVGIFGLLQPFADGLKLMMKETIMPKTSNFIIFGLSPILSLFLSLSGWAVIPFEYGVVLVDLNIGVLFIFAVSSLAVYGIMMAGWSSNSKYAFLGALRSAAQTISYEVSIGVIVMSVLICSGSFNLSSIVLCQRDIFYVMPLLPLFFMFFVSVLAETNSPPFDLPEAEGELVAGYFVEYSAVGFALFFIAEYSSMILMSFFLVILFFGGWQPIFEIVVLPPVFWLALKVVFFCFMFVWVSASLPSYRYDQLMYLGWKVFLPFSIVFMIYVFSVLFLLSGLVSNIV